MLYAFCILNVQISIRNCRVGANVDSVSHFRTCPATISPAALVLFWSFSTAEYYSQCH